MFSYFTCNYSKLVHIQCISLFSPLSVSPPFLFLSFPSLSLSPLSLTYTGILVNDSIVGDPLFSIPLTNTTHLSRPTSLCYEIHGRVNTTFNLISDRCITVNGRYKSLSNASEGNVIESMGIKTVDNNGRCINIITSLGNQSGVCHVTVNRINIISRYNEGAGVVVIKKAGLVRVSVPNCDREELVMWIMCDVIISSNGRHSDGMIDFVINRGANLSPSSHGLVGE